MFCFTTGAIPILNGRDAFSASADFCITSRGVTQLLPVGVDTVQFVFFHRLHIKVRTTYQDQASQAFFL